MNPSLLSVTLPYMAWYYEVTDEKFENDNTIMSEGGSYDGFTCWSIAYALKTMTNIEDSEAYISKEISSLEYDHNLINYLIDQVNTLDNIFVLFEELEVAGTWESHTFAYIITNGHGYYIPITLSIISTVIVDKPIEEILKELELLVLNDDLKYGERLVAKYFPGLGLGGEPHNGSYTVNIFKMDLLIAQDLVTVWNKYIEKIPSNRLDLLKEAITIRRTIRDMLKTGEKNIANMINIIPKALIRLIN